MPREKHPTHTLKSHRSRHLLSRVDPSRDTTPTDRQRRIMIEVAILKREEATVLGPVAGMSHLERRSSSSKAQSGGFTNEWSNDSPWWKYTG